MTEESVASSSSSDKDLFHARKTVKSYGIEIDSSKIDEVAYEERPESLRELLGVNVFDQEVFEEGVLRQVDDAIAELEDAYERGQLEKELRQVEKDLIRHTEQKLKYTERDVPEKLKHLVSENEKLEERKEYLVKKLGIKDESEIVDNEVEYLITENDKQEENSAERLLSIGSHEETDVERLIRLGEMTPFGSVVKETATVVDNVENKTDGEQMIEAEKIEVSSANTRFATPIPVTISSNIDQDKSSTETQTKISFTDHDKTEDQMIIDDIDDDNEDSIDMSIVESDEDYIPDENDLKQSWEDDQFEEDGGMKDDKQEWTQQIEKLKKYNKKKVVVKSKIMKRVTKDDGDDKIYQARIREVKLKKSLKEKGIDYSGQSDEEDNIMKWDQDVPDEEFDNGLKIPGNVWHKLFRYQKTGVKWLWELHCQQAGGIIGDEMGLGKTIQMIAFLAGLKYSNINRRTSKQSGLGPVLIVCPATVMYQWVAEFQKWWPEFRVAVLHDTGSHQGPKGVLINKIRNTPGILVTTYSGVRLNQEYLLPAKWDYVILDEGHIIRNPDAEITLACKQFRTCHRIILSGSPMQNNLRELWSLFDFVFPGKLGTLPVFMQEFSVPITMGGYANASPVQVQTAYKCACILRDTINPYLIRRLKKDVKTKLNLPNKNEQVLFCCLTEEQTEVYKEYLASRDVSSILAGSMKVFPGLIMLRKICNHPDLTTEAGSLWKLRKDEGSDNKEQNEYGYWERSGKMIVVQSLLKLWKKQKHKVLLFSQTRQMLKILEIFVKSQGYKYLRMDGSTSIGSRQSLVQTFNKDKSIFVFLLTTRVGGLGVNLVGADRVVIYDPDWNPGTDTQAKERAWRVGQKRDVTIYRLVTTGTIEEKIYHRQIFKQFLTNRVLKDPKQRRFFKSNDLFELFTLDTGNKKSYTETGAIFAGIGCEVQVPTKTTSKNNLKIKKKSDLIVKNENFVTMMKERTKEILRSQFSSAATQITSEKSTRSSGDARATSDCIRNESENNGNKSEYTSDNDRDVSEMSLDVANKTENSYVSNSVSNGGPKNNTIVLETAFDTERPGSERTPGETVTSSPEPEKRKLKTKKNKKNKRNKIEGIHIGQLSHSEAYVSKKDCEESSHDDQYILRKLFKKSGVHSALQHDTIVDSGNSDHILVENEAKRVAAQAAEALKRSREQCVQQQSRSGLPTWTGQSGCVGSPRGVMRKSIFGSSTRIKPSGSKEDNPLHFSGDFLLNNTTDNETKTNGEPMSSSQLLARMRARNLIGGNNTGSEALTNEENYNQTMAELRHFIANGCSLPGHATTQEILEKFTSKLPVNDTAIFRAMLKTICNFDRGASGEGYWVLKDEF